MAIPSPSPLSPHSSWPLLFEAAFAAVADRLDVVLDFASVREAWLQAELCLYLRSRGSDVTVNTYALGGGCKLDFHATVPSPMVAELKLLGNGYNQKCFDGNAALDRFLPAEQGGRVRITPADLDNAASYFLHDCARLGRVRDVAERYMILAIDRRGKLDTLGRALTAAQLSDDEWTWEPASGSMLIRMWRLPAAADAARLPS